MEGLSPERVDEILRAAGSVRAVVVGDVMADRYVAGGVRRVSPEAPVPIVGVEREWSGVGGSGNVALTVAALGAACELVGCVGADAEGEWVRSAVEERGVGAAGLITVDDRPTTLKTRVLAGHRQIVRLDREVDTPVEEPVARRLAGALSRGAEGSDVIVVEDYDKGVMAPEVVRAALGAADERGIPCVVDPKRRGFFDYAGATLLKPNLRELEEALGERPRLDDPAWTATIRERCGCRNLVVTLGEEGMVWLGEDGDVRTIPAIAKEVYDVSGAGDTVTAALAVALAAGASVPEAAALATHAAAVAVGRPGVSVVGADDVRAHVRNNRIQDGRDQPPRET